MVKKYDIDSESVAEPIEIVLDGKTYTAGKIKSDTLEQISKLGDDSPKDEKGNPKDSKLPIKQLAMLLNVDPKELEDVDIRKIGKALKYIQESITKSLEELKN